MIRAAKHGLNAIDPFDMADNYRLEQGFTYELNLYGDGDEAPRRVHPRRPDRHSMTELSLTGLS